MTVEAHREDKEPIPSISIAPTAQPVPPVALPVETPPAPVSISISRPVAAPFDPVSIQSVKKNYFQPTSIKSRGFLTHYMICK